MTIDAVALTNFVARAPKAAAAPSDRRAHLLGPRRDFWMLGGVTFFSWLIFFSASTFLPTRLFARVEAPLLIFGDVLSVLFLYPHFLMTYRMAYSRGWTFTRRHWMQLIGFPLFMFGFGLILFSYKSVPIQNAFFLTHFAYLPFANWGQLAASMIATVLTLFVGWHHSKQTFGTMMITRTMSGYPINLIQRRLLIVLIYALWMANVIAVLAGPKGTIFAGVPIYPFPISKSLSYGAAAAFWIFLGYVSYQVFYQNWKLHGRKPSATMLIQLFALVFAWIPPFYNASFYYRYSPAYHGLQYSCVAARYEHGRRPGRTVARWIWWAVGFSVASVCLLIVLPMGSDQYLGSGALGEIAFYMIFFHVTLNLHHYVIDHVIWRLDHAHIKRYIFDP